MRFQHSSSSDNYLTFSITTWHGMKLNEMENEMEWNGNFGIEYGRCQNGMEWKILRMEWKAIFLTSIPIPN